MELCKGCPKIGLCGLYAHGDLKYQYIKAMLECPCPTCIKLPMCGPNTRPKDLCEERNKLAVKYKLLSLQAYNDYKEKFKK